MNTLDIACCHNTMTLKTFEVGGWKKGKRETSLISQEWLLISSQFLPWLLILSVSFLVQD
jgi:hypothetical protein